MTTGRPGKHLEAPGQFHLDQAAPDRAHVDRHLSGACTRGRPAPRRRSPADSRRAVPARATRRCAPARSSRSIGPPRPAHRSRARSVAGRAPTCAACSSSDLGGSASPTTAGRPGAEDAGLLQADALARRPQVVHVIEADAGDDGAVRVEQVDCVEPAAQPDLQDRDVQPGFAETAARRRACRTRNRSARCRRAPPRRARRRRPAAASVASRAVDPHALVVAQQVRRGIQADAIAGARSIASSMAQVEPLPLVPPTVMTGQASASPRRSRTRATRSSPRSIVRGCTRSR